MYRIDFIHSIVMSSALLVAASLAAQSRTPLHAMVGATPATVAQAPAIASRDVDTQIMHDVTAAAVIGVLKSQFKHRNVELKLGLIESNPANRRDLRVHGTADIRIEGSRAWLPISFAALYDSITQTAISPTITLVRNQSVIGAKTASLLAASGITATGLGHAVAQQLAKEFAAQSVDFDLDTLRIIGGDERYAVVDGSGVASFADQGEADVQVQAVYDRQQEEWIRVDYRLGKTATTATVAVR